VHTIFGEAVDTTVATVNAATSGSHFVINFMNFTSFNCLTSSIYTLEQSPRSTVYFRNFTATISLAESLLKKLGNDA
jgi:hypothetical protein